MRGAKGQRSTGDQRDHLCDPQRVTMARCSEGLLFAPDDLSLIHPLEQARRVRPHLRNAGGQGWEARPADDRYNPRKERLPAF